jgi:phage-related protein
MDNKHIRKALLFKLCQLWHNIAMSTSDRHLFWVSSAREDLRKFPEAVKRSMGFALRRAQAGGKHLDAKPLQGFGGAGVLEIVEDDDGKTYRAVYTVKFAGAVYVLHAFQKKSTQGISTPHREIDLIKARLKRAEEHYCEWCRDKECEL